MSPEQLTAVRTAYGAKAEEWSRWLIRPDVPWWWLRELHARLSGPEFAGSGEVELELFRVEALLAVEDRMAALYPDAFETVLDLCHIWEVG